ncbi:MAG: FAD-linked oxidase C-terminal domain-containing protein [Desulfobacterales bacterium]|nr:FAD-linked oxidase C-terminal domain-containing protein [Desulfobacterales bacterium]MDD4391985.1 FAD-linked oxidase C-terminal domain-containing protein [Desulfobacterales bacterium]
MYDYCPLSHEIFQRMIHELGPECVLIDTNSINPYDRDASELRYMPDVVVKPRAVHQIQKLMALANEYRFPVTPRGAGTGLAGGCLAVQGGVVLSLEHMNRIRKIDSANLVAEVEPGVLTQDLRDAARKKGLFYPPDPAGMDKSTIGGNAATNAGGPACAKYGTTKDYVLELEAVLPSGRRIRTGAKTRKGVVGYDMTHLLVGSEGTLGIITGLTLKLIPHPPAVTGLTAAFSDLDTAMRAVMEIMNHGHLPSAIEFLDKKCLKLVGDLLPFQVPGDQASLLIIETDGVREPIEHEISQIGQICEKIGATHLMPAPEEKDRERIWGVRRQVSLRIHDHSALYIAEDIVVPIGRIADLVNALPEFERRYNLYIYAFGHAGDGNIHLNITAENRDHMDRVEKGVRAILSLVLEMDGTISGEHGIGAGKMNYLPMELEPENIRLQVGIKKLFDPNLILNPGKLFRMDNGETETGTDA